MIEASAPKGVVYIPMETSPSKLEVKIVKQWPVLQNFYGRNRNKLECLSLSLTFTLV